MSRRTLVLAGLAATGVALVADRRRRAAVTSSEQVAEQVAYRVARLSTMECSGGHPHIATWCARTAPEPAGAWYWMAACTLPELEDELPPVALRRVGFTEGRARTRTEARAAARSIAVQMGAAWVAASAHRSS